MIETFYIWTVVFAWMITGANGLFLVIYMLRNKSLPYNIQFYTFLLALSYLIANKI